MDPPNADRRKKKDKAKEKFDRNGGHSQKHVRIQEAIAAKKAEAGKSKNWTTKTKKHPLFQRWPIHYVILVLHGVWPVKR